MKKSLLLILTLCCFPLLKGQTINPSGDNGRVSPSVRSVTDDGNSLRITGKPLTGEDYRNAAENEEAIITLEVGVVWHDNTGYQLWLDADATALGKEIPDLPAGSFPAGDISDAVFNAFEYTIPEDAEGKVNTEKVLRNRTEASIRVPAGKYDYVVVNPSPGENTFWISTNKGTTPGRMHNFEVEAGYHYTFVVGWKDNQDYVNLKKKELPVGPTIMSKDEIEYNGLRFQGLVGRSSASQIIPIITHELTQDISVTSSEPAYEISSDNIHFATTATLPKDGGSLYVRFTPPSTGMYSLKPIKFESEGAKDLIINMWGEAWDCNDELGHNSVENFEKVTGYCWLAFQQSSDPQNEMGVYYGVSVLPEDPNYYSFKFSSEKPNPDGLYDQYLVSPPIKLNPEGYKKIYFYCRGDKTREEKIAIGYSTTTNDPSAFNWYQEYSILDKRGEEWIRLENYDFPGNARYFAIKYIGSESTKELYIDHIVISEVNKPVLTIPYTEWVIDRALTGKSYTSHEFSIKNIGAGTVTITNVESIEAPWTTTFNKDEVSLSHNEEYKFTISYEAENEGLVWGELLLTTNQSDEKIKFTLLAYTGDCTGDAVIPLTMDFEDLQYLCWTPVQASIDPKNVMGKSVKGNHTTPVNPYVYMGCYEFSSLKPNPDDIYDQYLISPELPDAGEFLNLLLYYKQYSVMFGREQFRIGYSLTDDNLENFKWFDTHKCGTDDDWHPYNVNLPKGTKYVAIHYNPTEGYYLLIDDIMIRTASDSKMIFIDPPYVYDYDREAIGNSSEAFVKEIACINLTEDIAVRTTLPFEVSGDGVTYAANTTIAKEGGKLYIRFSPTAVGNHSADVVITTDGVDPFTIKVEGKGIDCPPVTKFPWTQGFENGIECMWLIDNDKDNRGWEITSSSYTPSHSGDYSIASYSVAGFVGAIFPDNYLITPPLALPEKHEVELSWWVGVGDPNKVQEHYEVRISETGKLAADFKERLFEETLTSADWKEQKLDLTKYAGKTVYIAFIHNYSSAQFSVNLDDLKVSVTGVSISDANVETVKIYPNPSRGEVNVEVAENSVVRVIDAYGRIAALFEAEAGTSLQFHQETGIYMIRIENASGVSTHKLIVK